MTCPVSYLNCEGASIHKLFEQLIGRLDKLAVDVI